MTTFREVPGETLDSRAPTRARYYPALDGLRAVAFLMVFAIHYLHLPWGWAGVDIFFVLSGFLITGILYDARNQPHRVYNFYLRRTLRIFPLFYGLFLALLFLQPIFHWGWNWHWLAWPLYLGNFARAWHPAILNKLADGKLFSLTHPRVQLTLGHLWSLCVEEQFYLVWPWLVFWIKDRRKLLLLCASSVVICPIARVIAAHTLPAWMISQEVLYRSTPVRVDALLLGGLIALLLRGPWRERLLPAARAGGAVCLVTLVLWMVLSPVAHQPFERYIYPDWAFTLGLLFIDLFAACILIMALHDATLIARVLSLRPLRWLGGISYGAYVFHDMPHAMLLIWIPQSAPHRRLMPAAIAFVFTLVAAWASFRWFETPFIRLKDRLSDPAHRLSAQRTPLRTTGEQVPLRPTA